MGKSHIPTFLSICTPLLRDRSRGRGEGGNTKWENRGYETFCTPSAWLKLQVPVLKLPQRFLCPLPNLQHH